MLAFVSTHRTTRVLSGPRLILPNTPVHSTPFTYYENSVTVRSHEKVASVPGRSGHKNEA